MTVLEMIIDWEWYEKHKGDYTEEEIAELGIEISSDGQKYPEILQGDKRGKVKKLVEAS